MENAYSSSNTTWIAITIVVESVLKKRVLLRKVWCVRGACVVCRLFESRALQWESLILSGAHSDVYIFIGKKWIAITSVVEGNVQRQAKSFFSPFPLRPPHTATIPPPMPTRTRTRTRTPALLRYVRMCW